MRREPCAQHPATTTACSPHEQLLCHEVVPRTAPSLTRDTGQTSQFTVPQIYTTRSQPTGGRQLLSLSVFSLPADSGECRRLEPTHIHKPRATMNNMRQGHEHAGPRLYVPNQRAPDLVSCAHYAPRPYARLGGCMSIKTKMNSLEIHRMNGASLNLLNPFFLLYSYH